MITIPITTDREGGNIEYYLEVYENQSLTQISYQEATLLCFMLKIKNKGGWRIPTKFEFVQIDWKSNLLDDKYRCPGAGRAPFDTSDECSVIERPLLPVRTVTDPAVHT